MVRITAKRLGQCALVFLAMSGAGCTSMGCRSGCDVGCDPCNGGACSTGCGPSCGWFPSFGGCGMFGGGLRGRFSRRSLAIPDEYPVGAVMRSHFHQMETNAEAADFILYQHDFVGETAELTPDGKSRIQEIAARMRSTPFPVLVEQSWNNSDPELDAHRRDLVASILAEKGNPDAQSRTFVSPAYGPGKTSLEAAPEYYLHTFMGSGNNNNNNGGFGGGGGGGGGFGGGGFGGGGGGGGSGGGFGM